MYGIEEKCPPQKFHISVHTFEIVCNQLWCIWWLIGAFMGWIILFIRLFVRLLLLDCLLQYCILDKIFRTSISKRRAILEHKRSWKTCIIKISLPQCWEFFSTQRKLRENLFFLLSVWPEASCIHFSCSPMKPQRLQQHKLHLDLKFPFEFHYIHCIHCIIHCLYEQAREWHLTNIDFLLWDSRENPPKH